MRSRFASDCRPAPTRKRRRARGDRCRAAAARALLARCVAPVVGGRGAVGAAALTTSPRAVAARMAELDPQAEIRLDFDCAACGRPVDVLFDTAAFFFAEVAATADRLYDEVHAIAWYYHWSEAEILGLPRAKRPPLPRPDRGEPRGARRGGRVNGFLVDVARRGRGLCRRRAGPATGEVAAGRRRRDRRRRPATSPTLPTMPRPTAADQSAVDAPTAAVPQARDARARRSARRHERPSPRPTGGPARGSPTPVPPLAPPRPRAAAAPAAQLPPHRLPPRRHARLAMPSTRRDRGRTAVSSPPSPARR